MFRSEMYEAIKDRILNDENIKKTGLATNEGSITNSIISAISAEEAKLYIDMGNLFNLAFIKDSFGEYLDKRINEFGVYRKPGDYAKGTVEFKGTVGTTIVNGTTVKINGLEYAVVMDITISAETEKNTTPIQAREVGEAYNMPVGTEFSLADTIDGVEMIVATTKIEGGIEPETDEEFKTRFYETQKNNATSGNVAHYIQWAKEVDGVYNARVTPLWNGPGTVKVAISGKENKPVPEEVIVNCREYIEQTRPIGATVTIVTTTNKAVNISASVELVQGYTQEYSNAELRRLIGEYFETVTDEVTYSKIYGIIAHAEFVNDCNEVLINSATSNVTVTGEEVAIIGSFNIKYKEI